MNDLRFIQDIESGLFFVPVPGKPDRPTATRDKAWLYDEHRLLTVIRMWYGSDEGVKKVNCISPEGNEYFVWCGRRGGSRTSEKKTKAVRKNGCIRKKNFKEP